MPTSLEAAAASSLEPAVHCSVPQLVLLLQVYREAVESPRCSVIHLTRVEADPPCDTFFPDITAQGGRVQHWGTHQYSLQSLQGKPPAFSQCTA